MLLNVKFKIAINVYVNNVMKKLKIKLVHIVDNYQMYLMKINK